ncbi:TPA: type 1 fimbrial protein [Citrobacter freundii]|nr:type 1 fimbrial protein [Citrobacter freundii]HEF0067711.1 type 1 fimbrial protein [Citrobacter freundii]
MSIIRIVLILGCVMGIHQTASAACTLNTQKIILSPEIVNDKQSIQSGGVIQTRTLSLQNIQSSGCNDSQPFSAQIIGDLSAMKQPGIIRSNVSGIGIKVTLETSTGRKIQWPSDFKATADEFRNSKINIELIKLDNQLAAGPAAGAINLQIRSATQSLPVVDIIVPAKYITMLNRSCTIKGNRTINVKLPSVALEQFSGPGSTAGRKPFTIDLFCKSDFTTPSQIILSWSGIENNHSSNSGVLQNIHPKGAVGIGIQVLDQQQRVINLKNTTYIHLAHQNKGNHSIPFHAQYYQTTNKVSPRIVRSVLYFNAEYQ